MKVVDARSGKELKVGQGVLYGPNGEMTQLLDLKPGLFSAQAKIKTRYRDHRTNRLMEQIFWWPLIVRWMHPSYLFQHVGFINS